MASETKEVAAAPKKAAPVGRPKSKAQPKAPSQPKAHESPKRTPPAEERFGSGRVRCCPIAAHGGGCGHCEVCGGLFDGSPAMVCINCTFWCCRSCVAEKIPGSECSLDPSSGPRGISFIDTRNACQNYYNASVGMVIAGRGLA